MYCVSLGGYTPDECIEALSGLDLAEIRLDLVDFGPRDVSRVFSMPVRLIATFRPGTRDDARRREALVNAIGAGAAFVDIEVDSSPVFRSSVMACARSFGRRVVHSYHNYGETPSTGALERIVNGAFLEGADLVKIAAKVTSLSDNARLLGMLDREDYRGRLLVVGLGKMGAITRIAAPFMGSPFTFLCPDRAHATAEGQLTVEEFKKAVEVLGYV